MAKKHEIIFILDKSGSMSSLRQNTISGYNDFLVKQKVELPKSVATLVQFNDRYHLIYEAESIKNVSLLNYGNYVTSGCTALLDAIGYTIKRTKKRHKSLRKKKRPKRVMCVIITDGYENASVKYGPNEIAKKIKKLEKKGTWDFIYLGANQDAILEARKYGIKQHKAMTIAADDVGISDAFATVSNKLYSFKREEKIIFDEKDRIKHHRISNNQ